MDCFSELNIQRPNRLKSIRRPYLLDLLPIGCVFLFSVFFSFWPSLGAFAIYVWALFVAFTSFYLLFYFLPRMTAKAYPPRSFKFKWLTNLYLSWAIPEKREALIRKGIALVAATIFFVRFYFNGSGDALETISNLQCDYMNPFEVTMSSIFNCLWIGVVIFSTVVELYSTPIFIKIRKFVLTPVLVLSVFFFPFIVEGVVGRVDVSSFQYRALLMGIELGLLLSFALSDWRKDSSFVCTKKERYGIVVGVLILIICNMSAYLWQNLFGPYSRFLPLALDLNVTHRLLIYLCFFLPVFYFFLLYPFDAAHRRAFLVCVSYGVFFGYISVNRVAIWSSVTTWPLHICNTAMYTMPLTLVFQTYGLFYFTMFVNVIGAFLALMMPNYSASLAPFSPDVVHFYINHFYAFFLPILVICLGVYKRPKMKYFGYSMIGFFFYYILVVFVNNYMTPRLPAGQSIDFFFINSNFIADKLGSWANRLFKQTMTFSSGGYTYNIHVIYLVLYYLVYCGLSLAMWYVYELLFKGVDEVSLLLDTAAAKRVMKEKAVLIANQGGEERGMGAEDHQNVTLRINQLSKRYGNAQKNAVTDFNLEIDGGKIYGFLGKNGAGKSTIIKAIVGLHGFNEGSITVCGYDVMSEPSEAKMLIGYVPDNYALYENLTGRQYISYIADLYKVSREERTTRLPDLLSRLEMKEQFDRPIKTYSHGMKQKIAIIAALIHEPKIWILDEPMTGLDPNSIFQIKELMRAHAAKGNIVFFSSHIIDVVKNLCDEVFIIKQGRLVEHCVLSDLKKHRVDLEAKFLTLTSENGDEAAALLEEERKFGEASDDGK